jgi:hypothetical protein
MGTAITQVLGAQCIVEKFGLYSDARALQERYCVTKSYTLKYID